MSVNDREYCKSDCLNFECSHYYDAGVERDLGRKPNTLKDLSKNCPKYVGTKRRGNKNDN